MALKKQSAVSKKENITTNFGFVRSAIAVPRLFLGDTRKNAETIKNILREAGKRRVSIVIFPELSITGYTLGDLFHQRALQNDALSALRELRDFSKNFSGIFCVGLPLEVHGKLFNVAAVISGGKILGLVPKTYIPGYKEFYEERWFASARDLSVLSARLLDADVPIGTDLLFRAADNPQCVLGVEICEDLWAPLPLSSVLAVKGATIIANLSASNELVGKADYRRELVGQQSARSLCGYLYVSAGVHESTTDVVYGGHGLIAENGHILKEAERFSRADQLVSADLDLEHLSLDRQKTTSFGEAVHDIKNGNVRFVDFALNAAKITKLERWIDPHPFVPNDPAKRDQRSEDIFSIQSAGLAKRLESAHIEHIVIGVSGGLDSTLALLVSVKAAKLLHLPLKNIHAVTMPGFATTKKTKSNAIRLAESLGVTVEQIDITSGAREHFRDIGHNPKNQNTTYENVQARYRTLVLMSRANQLHGLVVGTGDLSELALGWNTFTGDQISHYNVNGSVPKTLVRHLVAWVSNRADFIGAKNVLLDIVQTPISPELVRTKKGEITQKTEDLIGPYELHDFFLYHTIRWGSAPGKILFLASQTFDGQYSGEALKRYLRIFLERFFRNQWKRSVMPDGPKVGSISLSPRGDWRMPSDIEVEPWLREFE